MSGHSRWSQIKRKKGKADVERGKLFSKILREITVAAKNGGGDAKMNMRLKAAVAWMFERKGVIHVDAGKIAEDDLLALVLDAGALDMRRVENSFEIVTPPGEMDAVRAALEDQRVPVVDAQVVFAPQSTVRVEGKEAHSVLRLIEALEDLDDVQVVDANYDIP